MSIRKTAAAYFLLQGAAVLLWWLTLFFYPSTRRYFQFDAAPETSLLAFSLPDVILLGAGSLVAGFLCFFGNKLASGAMWLVSGAISYATLYCLALAVLTDTGWLGVTLMLPAVLLSVSTTLAVAPFSKEIFRQARPAGMARNIAKTTTQIVIFWGVLLFVLPYLLTLIEDRLNVSRFQFQFQTLVALIVFGCSSVLGLWSGYSMAVAGNGTPLPVDCPRRLVVTGPYGYVRNPMVISGLGQGLAVGLGLGSVLVLIYVVVGWWIWQFLVRPLEDEELQRQFGDAYLEYQNQIRCWRPALKPYQPVRFNMGVD
ncbi:MAG TPA: isoprenylcysteine carboxylmethyltransferase family protein [Pyrinomonadaceae bacterium]|nr:isoprenylcysteine carboxylmethyltransferase family protein [Pyrinomonadaceae bacterium]